MLCPQCRTKYPEGATRCPDCRAPLISDLSAEVSEERKSFVVVYESADPLAIALAKGLLSDAGIPFWTDPDEMLARVMVHNISRHLRFLVPGDQAIDAREVLQPLLSPSAEQGGV